MPWRRNLWVISCGLMLATIAFSLPSPFFTPFLLELGLKRNVTTWSGLIYAVTTIISALVTPFWGALADRHGRKMMIFRSGFGVAVVYLLIALVTDVRQLLVLRIMDGLIGGLMPVGTMILVANTPNEDLPYTIGVLQSAIATGWVIGPLLGGLLVEGAGIRSGFLLAGAVLIAASTLMIVGVEDRCVAKTAAKRRLYEDLRDVLCFPGLLAVLAAFMLIQSGISAYQPTLPLVVKQMVKDKAALMTGIVFALPGISHAICAVLINKIRKIDYHRLLKISILAAALLSAAHGLTRSIYFLAGLRFIFGVTIAAMAVAANVLVAGALPREDAGKAVSVLHGVGALGFFLGPICGGFLGDRLGIYSPFLGSAVFFLAAVGVLYLPLGIVRK